MDTPDSTTFKRCTKCQTEYPATAEYFRRSRSNRGGLAARCKKCMNQEDRDYRAANQEKIAAQCHAYYVEHADKIKATARKHYEENKDRHVQLVNEWRAANPDKVRETRRKWSTNNPEKERQKLRRWRSENPEKRRAQAHKRRALEKSFGGSFTSDDIEAIRKAQGNRCYICHKKLTKFHVDHFIPVALGGTNDPGNLRLACPHCNQSKNAKHPHELGILI